MLLTACGGGMESDSTGTGTVEESGKPEARPEQTGTESAGSAIGPGGTKNNKSGGVSEPAAGAQANKTAPAETSGPKRRGTKRCPHGISRRQCAELAKVVESPGAGKTQAPSPVECPPALSESDCKRLGEIARQGANGQPPPQGECPPALTEAQCRELEEAYEKAAR
jgi:hypothetical protein